MIFNLFQRAKLSKLKNKVLGAKILGKNIFLIFLFKSKAAEVSISQILPHAKKIAFCLRYKKVFSLPKEKFERNSPAFEESRFLMAPQEKFSSIV